ncbi:MAG: GFA family protein, partial [Burkholderiales bacterium]|nr:GFA family protein [Burkholderiales bacterium]
MSAAGDARGGCHCGAVRFVARFPSRFVAHCHCASCRRAHGAAFVTWAGFPSDQVAVSEGTELLKVHVSSPGTKRSFCGVCGTKLFFQSEKWPGETHVPLAAFDEPVDRPP